MIRVVAVGNGAGNIVDQLRKTKTFPDVEFLFCDTDKEALDRHGIAEDKHVLLTPNMEQLRKDVHADNAPGTVLVCCLGGHATSKYALEIAQELRDSSDKAYCVASIPASYEGAERIANAMRVFEQITGQCGISILQNNDNVPGCLNISQMDNGIVCLLDLLLSHPKKGTSKEDAELPFAVWATANQVNMALNALYSNNPELASYYEMGTFSFHKKSEDCE